MADLLLQTSQHGDQTRVAVIGALQGSAARSVLHDLRHMIKAATPPRLVIDLRCCTGIDTHGILTLITAYQAANTRGGVLTLAAVPPLIHHFLKQHPQAHTLLPTES
jgi:anti-anti-sigma regulatory factor